MDRAHWRGQCQIKQWIRLSQWPQPQQILREEDRQHLWVRKHLLPQMQPQVHGRLLQTEVPTHIPQLLSRHLQRRQEEEELLEDLLELLQLQEEEGLLEALLYRELLFPEVFKQEICNLEVNQEFP